ncbi:hypothetical protein E2C06_32960 [Dankookia rubra]|uniref:Uncharacterized protein n=1 Tax=Dankookia rubra TaxID=1442381 RepID=A0A4R5Q657_9PROT|nr:hypothetical protein [Dankookia rubra]TDH58362.1 hypothetical protein E2C06_32960 [Dankookia rubra]
MTAISEASSCFVLIIQGAQPWAGVVEGIEGVREALVQVLWTDPEQALVQDVAAALASLDEPEAWASHGLGDGRPYWHWWHGYDDGSITVQRLTERPSGMTEMHLRSAVDDAAQTLTDLAADLRKLAGTQGRQYVFARSDPGQTS